MAIPAGPSTSRSAVRSLLPVAGFVLLLADPAAGQASLLVEGRAGVSIPTAGFTEGPGGGRLAQAPAAGLHFGLLRGSRTYVYLGFSQARIDCSRDGCPSRWVATQWEAGVRVELARGPAVPWIRAGVVTPTVENVPVAPGDAARRPGTSERGWGAELGAGVRLPLSERLSLSPGARYVAVDVGREGADDLAMRYLVVDLGVVVGF